MAEKADHAFWNPYNTLDECQFFNDPPRQCKRVRSAHHTPCRVCGRLTSGCCTVPGTHPDATESAAPSETHEFVPTIAGPNCAHYEGDDPNTNEVYLCGKPRSAPIHAQRERLSPHEFVDYRGYDQCAAQSPGILCLQPKSAPIHTHGQASWMAQPHEVASPSRSAPPASALSAIRAYLKARDQDQLNCGDELHDLRMLVQEEASPGGAAAGGVITPVAAGGSSPPDVSPALTEREKWGAELEALMRESAIAHARSWCDCQRSRVAGKFHALVPDLIAAATRFDAAIELLSTRADNHYYSYEITRNPAECERGDEATACWELVKGLLPKVAS